MLMQSRLTNIIISTCIFIFGMIASYNLQANTNDFEFHGFLSQGYIKTSANNFLDTSSEGSFDLAEAVVNGRYSISDDWYLATQLISRDYGDYHVVEQDIGLDYGLLGGKIFSESNQQLNFQIGMVKIPFGLLNIGRDIPSTHIGILLPQSIYNEYNRNKNLSNYGGILQYNNTQSWGDIQASLAIGKINISEKEHKEIVAFYGRTTPENLVGFRYDSNIDTTAQLIYSTPGKHLRLGFTFNESEYDYNYSVERIFPAENSFIIANVYNELNVHNRYYLYSMEFQLGDWSFLTEILKRKQYTTNNAQVFGQNYPFTADNPNTEFKYFQVSYALNEQVELFSRYEHGYWDTYDKSGSNIPYGNSYVGYHKNFVVGVDWYITDNLSFKAEYHKLKGCASLHWINNDYFDLTEEWSMQMLQMVYHF